MIKALKDPEPINYFESIPQNKEIFGLFKSDRMTYLKIAESSMLGHV